MSCHHDLGDLQYALTHRMEIGDLLRRKRHALSHGVHRNVIVAELFWHAFFVPHACTNRSLPPVSSTDPARLAYPAARLAGSGRMIQIAPQIRILVGVEAMDGRKGH